MADGEIKRDDLKIMDCPYFLIPLQGQLTLYIIAAIFPSRAFPSVAARGRASSGP